MENKSSLIFLLNIQNHSLQSIDALFLSGGSNILNIFAKLKRTVKFNFEDGKNNNS
jgi:hypothetical protein